MLDDFQRNRPAGAHDLEEAFQPFDDIINLIDLFVQRSQDVTSIDTKTVAENHADGKLMLYLKLAYRPSNGDEYFFSPLISKKMLKLGWPVVQCVDVRHATRVAPDAEAVAQIGFDGNQVSPVLILVSDLVNGPESVIPSRVWLFGTDEFPLVGSELLFQSVLHPFTWKFIRLPGVVVDASEREPYARRPSSILGNQGDRSFVQRRPDPLDNLNAVKGKVDIEIHLSACNYVRETILTLHPDRVRAGLQVPVNEKYQVCELALSTGNIFF